MNLCVLRCTYRPVVCVEGDFCAALLFVYARVHGKSFWRVSFCSLVGVVCMHLNIYTLLPCVRVCSAVIGSFSSRVYVCVACLWLLLCFGAAMLPPLTGIQIDAVSPDLRTLASGISMFFYNILGYALGAMYSDMQGLRGFNG